MANSSNNRLTVGLVQINNSYSGQSYLPYSAGLLQAYTQQYAPSSDSFDFLPIIFQRMPVEDAVQKLLKADVVGFSSYIWNERISLAIAKRLKELAPHVLIVFGGPQVPDHAEAFLKQHRFIDLVVHGEGEVPFLKILETFQKGESWQSLQSVSFLMKDGVFAQTPKAPRLNSLSDIPSPYLSRVFEPLIEANPQMGWIVVWETNRGCPFSCAYCDWGSATQSRVYSFDLDRLFMEVEWFAKQKVEFVFCADANYGMLDRDYDITKYVADVKVRTGYPKALSVQNTKNATEKAYRVQKLLADSGLCKAVTISFQSTDPQTLKNIKRGNISSKSFQELQRRFTRDQIPTYTDIILGLPGETYETFASGVSEVIQDGQHNRIVFNNLSILPNAEMGKLEYQKQFGLETIENEVVYPRGLIHKEEGDIPEIQKLVIATSTLSKQEWVRTRAFAWMTNFLHFNKLFQIPSVILHEVGGVSYRDIFEIFTEGEWSNTPILKELKDFFVQKAQAIQQGDYEFCPSKEWLGMYWPADEYAMIKFCVDGKMNAFYEEAEQALFSFMKSKNIVMDLNLIKDAIQLNRLLVKQPFQTANVSISTRYNIWEFYRGIITGLPVPLEGVSRNYNINRVNQKWNNWDDWCREVVWYGNKSATYLYPINAELQPPVERQLAGHH